VSLGLAVQSESKRPVNLVDLADRRRRVAFCGVQSPRDNQGRALGRLGGAVPQEWAKFLGTER
jgi:hypothetical protein